MMSESVFQFLAALARVGEAGAESVTISVHINFSDHDALARAFNQGYDDYPDNANPYSEGSREHSFYVDGQEMRKMHLAREDGNDFFG